MGFGYHDEHFDHVDLVTRALNVAALGRSTGRQAQDRDHRSPRRASSSYVYDGGNRDSHYPPGRAGSVISSRMPLSYEKAPERRDSGYSRGGGSVCMSDWSGTLSPKDSISQVSTRYASQPAKPTRRRSSSSRASSGSRSNSQALVPYLGPREDSVFEEECNEDGYYDGNKAPYCCKVDDHRWNAAEQPYLDERKGQWLRDVKPAWR